jgi:sulfate/thiosulfate transport system substrate-binding protein
MIRFLRRGGAADAARADARPRGDVRFLALGAVGAALSLGVAACGGANDEASGSAGGGAEGGTIDLVAYSTPETAYTERLQPGFTESPQGEGVAFRNSFGASGDQSRAVEAGLPADLVHLPLEPDMTRLVDAGLISSAYEANEYKGGTQNSVVVIGVRPGNPENIDGWEDLVTGDVEVITPNPFTSGGARWNLMAAYGSQIAQGKSEAEALEFVRQVLEHTPVQDASARDSLQTFIGGKGDAFLSYENEAIGAIHAGEELEYVVPDQTILIETKTAVTTDADDPQAAQAFIDWQLTADGQRAWAESGYRPVDEKVLAEYEDEFPQPEDLFTIEEFGGWETVATEFFDPENGSVAEIERDLGVATE